MKFEKIILLLIAIAIIVVVIVFAMKNVEKENLEGITGGVTEGAIDVEKLNVVVTSFVPYDFIRQIAGDKVKLTNILAPRNRATQL